MSAEQTPVEYVVIGETDSPDAEVEEFQLETDGTLLVSTLQVQYPTATGIKYRNPDTGTYRTLKVVHDRIHPPTDSQGWRDRVFVIVRPKELVAAIKREAPPPVAESEPVVKQQKRTESQNGSTKDRPPKVDLIVLGLSYTADENEVTQFFNEFGEVDMVEIKKKVDGSSRGFAFIRYKSITDQRKVLLNSPYHMAGRTINVRRGDIKNREADSCRLFITKLTHDVYPKDLEDYFSQYGKVVDVFIPRKTFRGFGFLTFETCDSVYEVLDDGEAHSIKNEISIIVSRAMPRGGGPMNMEPPGRFPPPPQPRGRAPFPEQSRFNRPGEGPSLLQEPMPGGGPIDHEHLYHAVKKVLQDQPMGDMSYGDGGGMGGIYRGPNQMGRPYNPIYPDYGQDMGNGHMNRGGYDAYGYPGPNMQYDQGGMHQAAYNMEGSDNTFMGGDDIHDPSRRNYR